jgi:TPR repeat protein
MYYLFGYESLPVNYDKAFSLLSAAAEQGATRAIANLADMYAQGLGTTRDLSKAIELYESVGHREFFAALALGRIYARGLYGDIDSQKARYWYSAVGFKKPGFDCEGVGSELTEAKDYISRADGNG